MNAGSQRSITAIENEQSIALVAKKVTLNIVPIQRQRVLCIVSGPDALLRVTATMPCIIQEDETVALFASPQVKNLLRQFIFGVFARYVPDLG